MNNDHFPRLDLSKTLTPHTDAAELAIKAMTESLKDRVKQQNADGMLARFQLAMNSAKGRAVAAELDTGAETGAAVHMMAVMCGQIIAGLVLQYTFDEPVEKRQELCGLLLLAAITEAMGQVSNIEQFGPHNSVGVMATNAPEATGRA